MRLHNRLVEKAGDSKTLERQYKIAKPFLKNVIEAIGTGDFLVNVPKAFKEGSPNIEQQLLYQAGYQHAMKTFLAYIDPIKEISND